jgi:hypothetical protein
MNARDQSEARLRRAIADAEAAAVRELECAAACIDPNNILMRHINAEIHREVAGEYRRALAEHLLLDGVVHQAMPEAVQ